MMPYRIFLRTAQFALIAITTLFPAWGQVASTGSVQGTVADQTGAMVAGAALTLRNVATGAVQAAESDASGTSRFTTVPVSRYTLEVKGRVQVVRESRIPSLRSIAVTLDVSLEIGQTAEQVSVSGVPRSVDTVTASEGNTVTGKQLNTLRLTNRLFTQMMLLEPGVSSSLDQTPGFGSNSSIGFSMNGVRSDANNIMIDGVRDLDTLWRQCILSHPTFLPSPSSALKTIRIRPSRALRGWADQPDLALGRQPVSRNAFEFFRNDQLNARNFFVSFVPENRYNDFGYDIGGPIKKNKLFFFWPEEWRRIIQSDGTTLAVVPTGRSWRRFHLTY